MQKLLASPEVSLTNALITSDSLHCQDKPAGQAAGDLILAKASSATSRAMAWLTMGSG